MGALRTKMIEEMKLRSFSPRTQESYLGAVIGLVKQYRQSVRRGSGATNRLKSGAGNYRFTPLAKIQFWEATLKAERIEENLAGEFRI